MRIIITGGAGFIGSHLTDAYVNLGHKVAVIDKFLPSKLDTKRNPHTHYYRADICDKNLIKKIFLKEKPDIVNHHAAIAEVVRSLKDPSRTFNVNITGTMNCLEAFGCFASRSRTKWPLFVFASTGGAIYGDPKILPATEETPPNPLSPYGYSKLLGEVCVAAFARRFRFDYVIFRYGNVFGPRQDPKGEAGVVSIFGNQMLLGKRPKIFGDGSKVRDYVFVSDVVEANLLVLKRGHDRIFNLGWGKGVTDKKVFDAVARSAGFSQPPLYRSFRKGEIGKITLSSRRAKAILKWQPSMRFEDGVAATVDFLRSQI